MTEKKKPKKVFVEGPILPDKIASSISAHQSKTDIGEHSIFLAQVQQTSVDAQEIAAKTFMADEELFEDTLYNIRESAFSKFNLSCLHMYHSLGEVKVGEIYFFIFTSSPTPKEAAAACDFLVGEFKSKIRVDSTHISAY